MYNLFTLYEHAFTKRIVLSFLFLQRYLNSHLFSLFLIVKKRWSLTVSFSIGLNHGHDLTLVVWGWKLVGPCKSQVCTAVHLHPLLVCSVWLGDNSYYYSCIIFTVKSVRWYLTLHLCKSTRKYVQERCRLDRWRRTLISNLQRTPWTMESMLLLVSTSPILWRSFIWPLRA